MAVGDGRGSDVARSRDNGDAAGGPGALFPWIVWTLGSLCFFFAFFQRVTPSVMVDDLMRDFGVTAAVVGNLAAFYYYAYASLQIPISVVIDAWGARRMLAVAITLSGIGGLVFASTDDIMLAYLGRLLIGAGSAVGWVGTLKLISVWFPARRFALLSGMTSGLGMAGAVAGQAPVAAMVDALGWRGTLVAIAIMAFALAAAIWLVVRDRPAGVQETRSLSMRDLTSGLRDAARTPQTWVFAFLCGSLTAPQAAFAAVWGVPYLMQAFTMSRIEAAGTASFLLVGWVIGSPLAGWFSDFIGRRRVPMLLGAVIALATISCIVYVPGLPLRLVQALLLVNGIASGSMVLCFVTAREHNRPEAGSAAVGLVNTSVMACSALSQPLVGWILDLNWDGRLVNGAPVYDLAAFKMGLLVLVGCGVAAITMAVLARETYCRSLHARPGE